LKLLVLVRYVPAIYTVSTLRSPGVPHDFVGAVGWAVEVGEEGGGDGFHVGTVRSLLVRAVTVVMRVPLVKQTTLSCLFFAKGLVTTHVASI
jgi:hypothetical protein